jgi:hypothetical protein
LINVIKNTEENNMSAGNGYIARRSKATREGEKEEEASAGQGESHSGTCCTGELCQLHDHQSQLKSPSNSELFLNRSLIGANV